MTLTEAFRHYGVRLKNPRNAPWTTWNEDGELVMTFWTDRIVNGSEYVTGQGKLEDAALRSEAWIRKRKQQREHLQEAFKSGAIVRMILVKPRDPNAVPREIEWLAVRPYRWRVVEVGPDYERLEVLD